MIAYGTCLEAVRLAPLVMELRRTKGLRPMVAVPGLHSPVLDELHAMLRIEPDIDLDAMGCGKPLAETTLLALGGRSASFERSSMYLHGLNVDVVVVGGETTTAFAVALAGFYARLPIVHVGGGRRAELGDASFAENQLGRSIAQTASLHLVPTCAERANLVDEGIDPADVVVTGPLDIDDEVGEPASEARYVRAVARSRAALEELLGIGRRLPDFSPTQAA
nr:UDP-N-acetylglucosamine 2-epimerase [Phytoactinopolyspora alkaliphila]